MSPGPDRAVLGAGLMGHGIAQVMAQRPGRVWLYDIEQPVLDRALERIAASLAQLVEYGLLSAERADAVQARIAPTTELDQAVQSAWLVVEASPEDLALKHALLAQVEALAHTEAIIASNSSRLYPWRDGR